MGNIASVDQAPILGQGTTNTTQGSQVTLPVKPEPLAFLRLDTGEVYLVPASDTNALNGEFDKWNRLIHEQLLANEVLALADERMAAIATAKATNPSAISQNIEANAREVQRWAVEWRATATESVRQNMQALDKLGGTGAKLIELVPLLETPQSKPYAGQPGKDNGDWKRKGMDLSKAWSVKGAAGIRDKFMQEARYGGLGPLRYMSSAKLKASWPPFKDKKPGGTKWADVYKADAQGMRKVDRAKLKAYLGEQVSQAKLKSTDFAKLDIEHTSTLGPEALAKWNENCKASANGKIVWGDIQLADIDLNAEAAAMRFFSGASLSAELAPLQGNLSLKAEGSVEVAFAEGKAAGQLYFPSKEGLMLYWLDLEQALDVAKGKATDTGKYDLGAIRLACMAELKGVIGVSLAGEVSIGVEMKDIDSKDVDGKTKPGRIPHIKGTNKKVKRLASADVSGQTAEWKNTAGVAANVNFFAGAKGGLGLNGAIEWRNPHSKDKKFEPFASIAPELQGMAGLAGEAKLAIEYVEGIFRITAHAGLCFGLGAEGTVTLAVGAKQLASFMYWFYYNLLNLGFRNAEFVAEEAFSAAKYVGYLALAEGRELGDYFGQSLIKGGYALQATVNRLEAKFKLEAETLELGKRVLANTAAVRVTPPESKGMLIYQLTRFGAVSWALDGAGLGSSYLTTQRQAVLAVLRQTQTKRDIENVIQHIHPTGAKVNLDQRLAELQRFFAAEGPNGLDMPGSRTTHEDSFQSLMRQRGSTDFVALNGDFSAWYEHVHASLMDEAPRGYPALDNSHFAYQLASTGNGDHPLFSSSEHGFYNSVA